MKILLTAFEPFGGISTNSSLEVFKKIDRTDVIKKELPVSYIRAKKLIKEYVDEFKPDLIISMGQAGGEKILRIEKVGLNYTRASISDNDNDLRKKGEIIKDAPLAIVSNLDLETIVDNAKEKGISSYISLSAGGYICNTVYYSSLYYNSGNAVFIHYPYYTGQVDIKENSLNLDKMVEETNYFIDRFIECFNR